MGPWPFRRSSECSLTPCAGKRDGDHRLSGRGADRCVRRQPRGRRHRPLPGQRPPFPWPRGEELRLRDCRRSRRHSFHAQVEADLGRAVPAMVRLLGLAQSSPGAPELYSALVQVCRFCGQLEASIAAHERARGLDPRVSTSVNQTYWHLGDLDRAFAARQPGTFGLDAFILARWGRKPRLYRCCASAKPAFRRRRASLPPHIAR